MIENLQKKYYIYKPSFNKVSLAIALVLSTLLTYSQNACSYFQVDIQGNEYTISNNELIKKQYNSQNTFSYSNKLFGNLHSADVSNPLRIILFYKEAQKLVITDNTLSNQNQKVISLEEVNLFQTEAIATSKIDNGIWMYDQAEFQLIKITPFLNRTIETGNLEQLLNLDSIQPIKMIEYGAFLYIQCKHNGILVFDIYGAFYKTIPLVGLKNWSIYNSNLHFNTDAEMSVMNLKTNEFESIVTSQDLKYNFESIIYLGNQFTYYCEDNLIKKSNNK